MKYLKIVLLPALPMLLFFCVAAQQKNIYPGFYEEVNKRIDKSNKDNWIDSTSKLFVRNIIITGNKRTKTYIILREMKFQPGDSVIAGNLYQLIEESKALIYNTTLFYEVDIKPIFGSGSELSIQIIVLEKIYIIPSPQFKLTDRNFNEWVKTYNADLNRVIYGARFEHYNLSGRGDRLRIILLNGYARNILLSYFSPYSNGALTEGFSVFGSFTQNREFNYKTGPDNKLLEFKKDGFTKSALTIGASYQRRRHFFWKTSYSISYNYIDVHDSVVTQKYNPNYFNSPRSHSGYPELQFSYQYSNTDKLSYPLRGKSYGFTVMKRGVELKGGMNMLSLDGRYSLFHDHKKNWYSSIELFSKLKLPFEQSYINQAALGYYDFYLRGLEYYVVDGVATGLAKYTLRKKLFAFDIRLGFLHIKKIPKIPFAFYGKTYADIGYSYSKKEFDTRLGNRLLYTGGFGLDILSIYDSTLKLEYSFNQLGENGLFLHIRSGF